MCCSRQDFGSLVRRPKNKKVYMGDGLEVPVYGIGTVELNANLVFKGVLYVPNFTVFFIYFIHTACKPKA